MITTYRNHLTLENIGRLIDNVQVVGQSSISNSSFWRTSTSSPEVQPTFWISGIILSSLSSQIDLSGNSRSSIGKTVYLYANRHSSWSSHIDWPSITVIKAFWVCGAKFGTLLPYETGLLIPKSTMPPHDSTYRNHHPLADIYQINW